ncbi:MAG: TOTE conflict system archaeo-eukaryotic primase domain-containing protein [Mycobacteriales bacterium]
MARDNRVSLGGAQLSLTGDLDAMRSRIAELEADNAHLRGMLKLSEQESKHPGAAPTVMFYVAPGTVTAASTAKDKVAFYANLFRARSDVYAVRWDSDRTGRGGWMPAVQGGFRKGVRPADRKYLPLAEEVVARHLSGNLEIGLYPLLDNDKCHWPAADFDCATALLDALAHLKAARAYGVTAALEVSRSGAGAGVWVFFTSAVPAAQARQLGTGLRREAMTMAGQLNLACYDRLFPSQDLLPAGGIGNLMAAPLQGRWRRMGTTVFLDLATLEPHDDPWSYLSSLPRVTPAELTRVAARLGTLRTGSGVDKVVTSSVTKINVPVPRSVDVELGGPFESRRPRYRQRSSGPCVTPHPCRTPPSATVNGVGSRPGTRPASSGCTTRRWKATFCCRGVWEPPQSGSGSDRSAYLRRTECRAGTL